MTTFLVQWTPKSAGQDTWAVAFSLPYIAERYARAGDATWYLDTWLTADQIRRRLAILFKDGDELLIHELRRADAVTGRLDWLSGRLADEDETQAAILNGPRMLWGALQTAVQNWPSRRPHPVIPPAFMVSTPGSSRVA